MKHIKYRIVDEIAQQRTSLSTFKKVNVKEVSLSYIEDCLNAFEKIVKEEA